jgi:hypothetical protein
VTNFKEANEKVTIVGYNEKLLKALKIFSAYTEITDNDV